MNVEHHPLIKDFPELRDRMHELKGQPRYDELAKEYEDTDKLIVRVENRIEMASGERLEQLKRLRLHLKDELYKLLKA